MEPKESAPDTKPSTPIFSLIVSTLGRAREIPRLLRSLEGQTEKRFELIVVDQNDDGRVVGDALSGTRAFPVRHLHRPGMRGLSRGRNAGLEHARGEFVVFPDDDCWYPEDFLQKALAPLASREFAFCCGRAADETGRSINGRFEATMQEITRRNVWTTSIEWMQIYRREMVQTVGGYDEELGIGASSPWQASEGQDLALRVLEAGGRGLFDPDLTGRHEELTIRNPDGRMRNKMRAYGRGMGYVLRKHHYRPTEIMPWLFRPLAGSVLSLCRLRPRMALMYLGILSGRCEGFLFRK